MSNTKQVGGSTTPGGQGGVQPNDTIYLCNFRVSVDGEWLCLKVISPLYAELCLNTITCLITITRIKTFKLLRGSTHSKTQCILIERVKGQLKKNSSVRKMSALFIGFLLRLSLR